MTTSRRSLPRYAPPAEIVPTVAEDVAPPRVRPDIDGPAYYRLSQWIGELVHYLAYSGEGRDSFPYLIVKEIDEQVLALEAGEKDKMLMPVALVGRRYVSFRRTQDDADKAIGL